MHDKLYFLITKNTVVNILYSCAFYFTVIKEWVMPEMFIIKASQALEYKNIKDRQKIVLL